MTTTNKSYNLCALLEELGSIKATIQHEGFYNKLHCYFNPGVLKVDIIPNKLKGGYIGNTLLVPYDQENKLPSHVILAIDDLLIRGAVFIVEINNIPYTLKKRHNFLRINVLALTLI